MTHGDRRRRHAETVWRPWLDDAAVAAARLSTGVAGRRVVVLAAHPDDEVLGVGGLLRRADRRLAAEIVAVWATDGEASHPGSTSLDRSPSWRALRRAESRRRAARLGVSADATRAPRAARTAVWPTACTALS